MSPGERPDERLAAISAWLGRETSFSAVDEVTLSDIRRKLEVYCFDCPLHYDEAVAHAHGYRTIVAPVTMTQLWAMEPYWSPGEPSPFAPDVAEKNGAGGSDIPNLYAKGFNASSEREFFEPLYPGDKLHGTRTLTRVEQKRTRLGEGVFMTREVKLYKQTGELVAIHRNTGYNYDPSSEQAERAQATQSDAVRPTEDEGATNPDCDWEHQLHFGDVNVGDHVATYRLWLNYQRIVMSVAADRMFSSIHHNRDLAREGGLDDIIFNTLGYEMMFEINLRRWMGLDGRIRRIGPFRMTNSSYPGDTLRTRCHIIDKQQEGDQGLVQLEISVANPRGVAASGEALLALPA